MTAELKVLSFPKGDVSDVSNALRSLADAIDDGEYGDAHLVSWVVDCGDGQISVGAAGVSASPGAEAHLLFAIAQRKLEHGGAAI